MTKELFGWAGSFVLVLTLTKQVHAQWRAGTSKGVSVWLFIGELAASVLFFTYSALLANWVYVIANVLSFAATVVGLFVWWRLRRRER